MKRYLFLLCSLLLVFSPLHSFAQEENGAYRLYTLYGNANSAFGSSISAVGDIDNDGVPDFIVGAWNDDFNGVGTGSATVFSGVDGTILYTFYGDLSDDYFGRGSGAGDIDSDGIPDLLIKGGDLTRLGTVQDGLEFFQGKMET